MSLLATPIALLVLPELFIKVLGILVLSVGLGLVLLVFLILATLSKGCAFRECDCSW